MSVSKQPDYYCYCCRLECAIVEVANEGVQEDAEPGVDPKAVSKVRRKARGWLQEMVANISPALIRYSFYTMRGIGVLLNS